MELLLSTLPPRLLPEPLPSPSCTVIQEVVPHWPLSPSPTTQSTGGIHRFPQGHGLPPRAENQGRDLDNGSQAWGQ